MDKIAKIKAELERLYRESYDNAPTVLHQLMDFINSLPEEPVSESIDFERELYKWFGQVKDFTLGMRIAKHFYKAGAQWQKEVFEKNRLAACDRATKEEIEREQDFVDKVLIGEQRQPTFSDAIEYGIKWQKNYVWHDAKKEKPERMEPLLIDDGVQFVIGDKTCIEETDKWCYITDILPNKED